MSKRASATFKLPLASPPTKRARLSPPCVAAISAPLGSSSSFSPATFLASLPTAPLAGSNQSTQDLLGLEASSLDPSWLELLQDEVKKPYFLSLKQALWKEGVKGVDNSRGKVFPPAKDIYAWSRYTPLHKVKVVIIGQDPYHDDGQAHGLCFSVQPGVKIPPSLRNIYKELKTEYPDFDVPTHGSLISLARSGVLLLNTSLTVRPHQAGSHSKLGWEEFTDKVVELVAKYGGSGEVGKESEGVVFLAWGAWAAKRVANVDKKKHLVLESPHPSPLSARRGFFGNGHFLKTNEWLSTKYGDDATINWTKLEVESAPTAAEVLHEGQPTASGSSLAPTPALETVKVVESVETIKEVENVVGAPVTDVKVVKGKGKGKVVGKAKEEETKEKGGKQSTLMAAWGKKA